MRSERVGFVMKLLIVGGIVTFAAAGVACGMMGKKENLNRLLNYKSDTVGCMNDIGAHVKNYYQGTIDAKTWGTVWDCATSNLELFKKFVKTSDANGYTRDDIRDFVSKFLVTNKPISPEMVGAVFELKASIFGGTKDVIGVQELDAVTNFLGVMREQSTALLPQMAARASAASPENLMALVDALNSSGDKISASLKTQGNPTFSLESVHTLAREVGKILDIEISPELVTWLNAVKVVLTAADGGGISASDWPLIVRSIVSYGGPALAMFSVDSKYTTDPNAMGRFMLALGLKLKTSMLQTMDLYGGSLPLTAIDSVIDSLPASWLTIDRNAVKGALRPGVNKFMQSRVPNAIDNSAVDLLFDKLQTWCDGQTALETVFAQAGAGPAGLTYKDFNALALEHIQNGGRAMADRERAAYYRMIALARDTVPLFFADDNQITFAPSLSHSLHNLSLFNIFSLVAEQVVKAYSTLPGGKAGRVEDLQALATDFTDIARELQASDLSVPTWAVARFTEGTLFTFASRGDPKSIDVREAMYLIAMGFSAGQGSAKLRSGADRACPSVGVDILGYQWKPAACFRKELFGNYSAYWDHVPLLIKYYGSISSSDKGALQTAMERCSRRYGVSSEPIGSQDLFGYSGIIQYVEALLARWDTNGDQHLNLEEAERAYPVFKGPLAVQGGISLKQDFLVHSVFTFVLKHGHPPSKNLGGILALAWWIAQKPFWSISADRLILYQVIASIVQPEPIPSSTVKPKALLGLNSMNALSSSARVDELADAGPDPIAEDMNVDPADAALSYEELSEKYGVPLDGQVPAVLVSPVVSTVGQ